MALPAVAILPWGHAAQAAAAAQAQRDSQRGMRGTDTPGAHGTTALVHHLPFQAGLQGDRDPCLTMHGRIDPIIPRFPQILGDG